MDHVNFEFKFAAVFNGSRLSPCVAQYVNQDWAAIVGTEVDVLTQADWDHLMTKSSLVFARVTPNHKLMIVEQCQAHGEIVAVTGDGVNDSPAVSLFISSLLENQVSIFQLKCAHIGVAMGLNGSDVAKEAADVILMDDNFASIVMAIEQGRLVFDNLMKTIAYTLTHLTPEIVPVFMVLALGMPTGLSTLQILSIDLGTELGPAISLAYEDKESDIMERPPRDTKKDRLVSPAVLIYSYVCIGFIESAGGIVSYLLAYYSYGIYASDLFLNGDSFFKAGAEMWCLPHSDGRCFSGEEQERISYEAASGWLIAVVVGQFFHIWTVRARRVPLHKQSMSNVVVFYGVVIELAIIVMQIYIPSVNSVFGSAPVGWTPWIVGIVVGVLIVIVNETRKKAGNADDDSWTSKLLW